MPVTKAVTKEQAATLKEGQEITLVDENGEAMAIMQVTDIYSYDKKREAEKCFGTTEDKHPGVARLYAQGDVLLGGPIQVLRRPAYSQFNDYRLTPMETRKAMDEKGWKTVVAFQTRNPVHRAHEYLQKVSL